MTNDELVILLKKWDKHLYGINASYKEAARLIGLDKPSRIKKVLDDACVWYKNPNKATGPKKATAIKNKKGKVIGLSMKQWDRLRQFFAEQRELIESDGVTMEFVIRLCRSNWLPANAHIVNEMLSLKKISLKGVV